MSVNAPKSCKECGSGLRPGVKFCEACGSPVPGGKGPGGTAMADPEPVPRSASTEERLIGQMPCDWITEKKGIFGGFKTRQGNLLITNRRLVFLHETMDSNAEEMAEDERVDREATRRGQTLREFVRNYDWFSGSGSRFVGVPVAALISEDSGNWEIPVDRLMGTRVFLGGDDDAEEVLMEVEGATPLKFRAFRASAESVAGWMTEVLGRDRVEMANQKLIGK